MKISAIYQIQSKIKPERIYIGSSVDLKDRWRCHLKDLRKNKHHSRKFQNHFNKYGEEDLIFIIIELCLPAFLVIREQYYIDIFKPYFNSSPVAGSCLGIKRSKETCNKISEYHKGKITWMKNKHHSKEAKEKLSKSHKGNKNASGSKRSEIQKQNQKNAIFKRGGHKGEKNPMFGKYHSEESKIKMRKPKPEGFRQKIKDSWITRKQNIN